ncbi:hypothetical protein GON26_17760 [Flavobacterium sp. GA093]|uniref:Uncharacterized protein n=1 Tax=Flavobacterium hydrocarbonoxydans TaxID=2683249 RepID=A0A6I4NT35_9FLAO|nr:hypothetical protein [Flavobacterium hydrocarbonoxydans]MWB96212.1 hypothetical protein [Flavobacterium hydrocarbonoxydans]
MKSTLLFFTILLSVNSFSQNTEKLTKPIVEEGKKLYKSEMASWYGTDLFIANYTQKENIGGYFSYSDDEKATCVFFSRDTSPKVIGTIKFDFTFDTKTANTNLEERDFTANEKELYVLRKESQNLIATDTFFKHYENSSLNLIPLISNGVKKVYVLCGPKEHGVVLFGNDYEIIFDKQNKVKSKKQLHKNIIPIYYKPEDKDAESIHSHLPETGDFITATDICTLMLYEKFAQWKNHLVVSKKYTSIWNCTTDELFVMKTEALEKIAKHQNEKN